MASQQHKTRESGESPKKDDERLPQKKTRNLADSELSVSCNSAVVSDGVECQCCKKWEQSLC